MSHHHEDTTNLSPNELKFNDCIRRAEDFMKIDQYLSAKECYAEAKELHFNDKLIDEKMQATTVKQEYERKIIIRILALVIVVMGSIWLYNSNIF